MKETETKSLSLSKSTGKAIKDLIVEVNESTRFQQIKTSEFTRLSNMLLEDAGISPEEWAIVGWQEDKNGVATLKLGPKPRVAPTPMV